MEVDTKSGIQVKSESSVTAGETSTKKDKTPKKVATTRKRKIECTDEDEIDSISKKEPKLELSRNELDETVLWELQEVLAEKVDVPYRIAGNVMKLLDEGNTIPFIARYRQDHTNGMDARKLTEVSDAYDSLRVIQEKVANVLKKVEQIKKLTPNLEYALKNAKTINEVEFLYQPYKTGSKKTLAEAARAVGLEPVATNILNGGDYNMQEYVKNGVKGLDTLVDIEAGVKHILADIFAKHSETLEALKNSIKTLCVKFESHQSKTTTKKTTKDTKEAVKTMQAVETSKFQTYYDFSVPVKVIRPHQVLAVNRGENLKVLSVKIVFPPELKACFEQLCRRRVGHCNIPRLLNHRQSLIQNSIEDAYKRLVEPLLSRNIRSELTKSAERTSVEVFVKNLNQLLLTPPVRGKRVLGIDPGFSHGCKIAVISATGSILDTDVIYLPNNKGNSSYEMCRSKLKHLAVKHRCEIVAIGNGTACRETEELISRMISSREFPFEIVYCIVNESGASIYSATDEAVAEMPDLHINLRSAVSIARRLQDPLAEYVKVEPKHLGVGMYQHDISETMLKKALDGVVIECVSFVGVDLNTGSEALLRKVAGLNAAKAKNILKWRIDNGPFVSREQLKLVKGLGQKSYEQCAGFVRILPATSSSSSSLPSSSSSKEQILPKEESPKKKTVKKTTGRKTTKKTKTAEPNLLDATCIHPESYDLTLKFLEEVHQTLTDIGKSDFIKAVKNYVRTQGTEKVAENLGTTIGTFRTIVNGLSQPLDYDMRAQFEKPLFRKGVNTLDQLQRGMTVTGRVANIVDFGAFVDIGVGNDGLIHRTKMRNVQLKYGDKVEVRILDVDATRGRIGLLLERVQ